MFSLMIRNCVLWGCGQDCWTEYSSVCLRADSSSDSCFWFSNILHSDLPTFDLPWDRSSQADLNMSHHRLLINFCVFANIIIVSAQDQLLLNTASIIGIKRRKLSILTDTIEREEKKWNKTGTSGCGSFVAAYFHPATSIDCLHLVLTSRIGSREAK